MTEISPTPSGSGRPKGTNDGDWICEEAECGNVNFARRTTCNRCNKEKPDNSKQKQIGTEIGKAAAEKSRGLFSADDWQCSKCGNVNWARRHQCNMCNAPKFGEVEERTGYGGGYNDRGVVEYIERQDSDDEYDEFGRKKRQFRKLSNSGDDDSQEAKPKENESASRVDVPLKSDAVDEEDEDDDEEEDEDGDLSKYDLTGWGDDDEKSDKESSSKENSKSDKGSNDDNSIHRSRDTGSRRRHHSRSSSSSNRSRSRSRSPR